MNVTEVRESILMINIRCAVCLFNAPQKTGSVSCRVCKVTYKSFQIHGTLKVMQYLYTPTKNVLYQDEVIIVCLECFLF